METSEEAAAVGSMPSQGALVHGFFVEGARWNFGGQVSMLQRQQKGQVLSCQPSSIIWRDRPVQVVSCRADVARFIAFKFGYSHLLNYDTLPQQHASLWLC